VQFPKPLGVITSSADLKFKASGRKVHDMPRNEPIMCRVMWTALLFLIAAAPAALPSKTETFDQDPHWDAFNNRQTPAKFPTVTQDFGYANDQKAIGGTITRTTTPAWYALKLPKAVDLNQPLSFSGNFAVPKAHGGTIHFGFFTLELIRQGGRPPGSCMIHIDGANTFVRGFVRVLAPDNQGAGTMLPPAKNVRSAIPLAADGTKHHFEVTYDPTAANGQGQFNCTIDKLPLATFELPPGMKSQPFGFTHFGLQNSQKSGSPMIAYFDDLKYNGIAVDLAKDPAWESHGNREKFEDHDIAGFQNYGFSNTGVLGGTVWRSERPSFYADNIGKLSLANPLKISGTLAFNVGAPDSGCYLAFFNADKLKQFKRENILGIQIEGPSRVGHYIRPVLYTSTGAKCIPETGPIVPLDNKPHKFALEFDPTAKKLTRTYDDKTQSIDIPEKLLKEETTFDHFGLFPGMAGGSQVVLSFDNLTYTIATP
jgi:hypothetical protein